MNALAGGEAIVSRLIFRGVVLDNVVSWQMTGMRDGGVRGNGEGGFGEVVGEGEERAEFRNRCFICSTAPPAVISGFGDELEGLENTVWLGFSGSRFVGRSGVLKLS